MSCHNVLPNNTNHNMFSYQQHLPRLYLEKIILWDTPSHAQSPARADKTKGVSQQWYLSQINVCASICGYCTLWTYCLRCRFSSLITKLMPLQKFNCLPRCGQLPLETKGLLVLGYSLSLSLLRDRYFGACLFTVNFVG